MILSEDQQSRASQVNPGSLLVAFMKAMMTLREKELKERKSGEVVIERKTIYVLYSAQLRWQWGCLVEISN